MIKLLEARHVKIKRSHTEKYPAVYADPKAYIRNKLVGFIASCEGCKAKESEVKEFLKSLSDDPAVGKDVTNYRIRGKDIITKTTRDNKKWYKLTKNGMRRHKIINDGF